MIFLLESMIVPVSFMTISLFGYEILYAVHMRNVRGQIVSVVVERAVNVIERGISF